MKKIFLAVFVALLCGCSLLNTNSPSDKVKALLDMYKNQDESIISQLEETISREYTGDFKDRYKDLMINQYKNMEYKITDEAIDKDSAVVSAEVTVYDYGSAIESSNAYLKEHEDEFLKENNKDDKTAKKSIDSDKYLDYKLKMMEEVDDRRTYNIEFYLTKNDNEWVLDDLSSETISKLHGTYME